MTRKERKRLERDEKRADIMIVLVVIQTVIGILQILK